MNILTSLFAQYTTTYNQDYLYESSVSSADLVALFLSFSLFFIFLFVCSYVLMSLGLMRIFKKAGVEGWIAWVPFYNSWKLLEIGGQQGFWAILAIIPFVNIVSAIFMIIAMYTVGLKLGKSGAYVIIAIFVPIIWALILGFDSSKWQDTDAAQPTVAA